MPYRSPAPPLAADVGGRARARDGGAAPVLTLAAAMLPPERVAAVLLGVVLLAVSVTLAAMARRA